MALTNTITARFPQYERDSVVTPGWELVQTLGSALSTAGAIKIFASATESDDFRLMSLIVSPTNPTSTSYLTIYAGTDAIMILPTATTTNTVSLFITTATQTVAFVATGLRKK
jgi:hypothetical protein